MCEKGGREGECVRERGGVRERERVCVCVHVRERGEGGLESVCVCVQVYVYMYMYLCDTYGPTAHPNSQSIYSSINQILSLLSCYYIPANHLGNDCEILGRQ